MLFLDSIDQTGRGPHRGAPEQHPKAHRIAIGQREFDLVIEVEHLQPRADHEAQLRVTAGVGDLALIEDVGLAVDHARCRFLVRVHAEAHEVASVASDLVDVKGMQARGARPGIDLGLDALDTQVG